MNNAGIVYEILKDKVIVLNPDGEFVFIRRKADISIGEVIKYYETDIYRNKKGLFWLAPVAAGITAIFIFVVLFANSFYINDRENIFGFVDVDINPSIEFAFDREYTVLKVVSLNDDADKVIEGLELKGEPVQSALAKFMEKSESLQYIDPESDNAVLISAALSSKVEDSSNKETEEKRLDSLLVDLDMKMKETNENKGTNITYKTLRVTQDERKEALNHKVSMGKYLLFVKAREQGVDIEIDELKTKKVSELLEKIDLLVDNTQPESDTNNSKEVVTEKSNAVKDKTDKPVTRVSATPAPLVSGFVVNSVMPQVSTPLPWYISTPKNTDYPVFTQPTNLTEYPVPLVTPQRTPNQIPQNTPQQEKPQETQQETRYNTNTPEVKVSYVPVTSIPEKPSVSDEPKVTTPEPEVTPSAAGKPTHTAGKPTTGENKNIKVQFFSKEKLIKTQGIHVDFRIVNTGADSVDLKNAKVRYYITREGSSPMRYAKYYFSHGEKSDFNAEVLKLSETDSYVEITFEKGIILPGKAAYVQGEILMEDWGYFDQSNDYSFNPSDKDYVDWDKMTCYVSGELVWGVEP